MEGEGIIHMDVNVMPPTLRVGTEPAWLPEYWQLRRDHHDLLLIVSELAPGKIHLDSSCQRMPPPHVLTIDCWPQPERTEPGPCYGPDCDHVSHRVPPRAGLGEPACGDQSCPICRPAP